MYFDLFVFFFGGMIFLGFFNHFSLNLHVNMGFSVIVVNMFFWGKKKKKIL